MRRAPSFLAGIALLCALPACATEMDDSPRPDEAPGALTATTIRVQAEAYARYYDTTAGNSGGACRSDDVDVQTTSDTGGGCNVGWTKPGEWLEYDVAFPTTGTYDLVLRVASAYTDKTGHVSIDGANVGSFTAPSSGWQSFGNRTIGNVSVSQGTRKVRVTFDTGSTNVNYLDLNPTGGGTSCSCGGPNLPFASKPASYTAGTIKPNHVSAATLDSATRSYYDGWKSRYLRQGCGTGRYYVLAGVDGGKSVSEGHGYGMLISVLIAGYDAQAKTIFDGLYRFFRDHPSTNSSQLMAWFQDQSCQDAQGADSATDGDLDIALALLMADKQWGSCGAIDYRAEALQVIAAIKALETDPSHHWSLLGDWVKDASTRFKNSTRPSDHMTGHFESFRQATGDTSWSTVNTGIYAILQSLQSSYASSTGLVPDFIEDSGTSPKPANNLLEGANDGKYGYNACRVPWRIGTAYLTAGHASAKTIVQKMNGWIRSKTGNNPNNIEAVYSLAGNAEGHYRTMAFVAPFGVSAMVDSSNQTWLNAVWNTVVAEAPDGYYEDTIKLLSMIVMSGNWWAPEAVCH